MILRRFSRWLLISVCILAFAGFIATLQLQRAINATRDRQAQECKAERTLQRATLSILSAIELDPGISDNVKRAIVLNEPRFTQSLQASHHC